MSKSPRWSRRDLLAGTASTIAGATLARLAQAQTTPAPAATQPRPLPAYVGWKDSSQVIVHTATTIETRRSACAGAATARSAKSASSRLTACRLRR